MVYATGMFLTDTLSLSLHFQSKPLMCGPSERRVCLQLLRLVCKAGNSTWSVQAFYGLGEERHEGIAYRDELRMLDINLRLFAQIEPRYFRSCTGQNLASAYRKEEAEIAQAVEWLCCGLDIQRVVVRFPAGQTTYVCSIAFKPALGPLRILLNGWYGSLSRG